SSERSDKGHLLSFQLLRFARIRADHELRLSFSELQFSFRETHRERGLYVLPGSEAYGMVRHHEHRRLPIAFRELERELHRTLRLVRYLGHEKIRVSEFRFADPHSDRKLGERRSASLENHDHRVFTNRHDGDEPEDRDDENRSV